MPESSRSAPGARSRGRVPVPRPPADDWPQGLFAGPGDGLGTYPLVRYAVTHQPGPHLPY